MALQTKKKGKQNSRRKQQVSRDLPPIDKRASSSDESEVLKTMMNLLVDFNSRLDANDSEWRTGWLRWKPDHGACHQPLLTSRGPIRRGVMTSHKYADYESSP